MRYTTRIIPPELTGMITAAPTSVLAGWSFLRIARTRYTHTYHVIGYLGGTPHITAPLALVDEPADRVRTIQGDLYELVDEWRDPAPDDARFRLRPELASLLNSTLKEWGLKS